MLTPCQAYFWKSLNKTEGVIRNALPVCEHQNPPICYYKELRKLHSEQLPSRKKTWSKALKEICRERLGVNFTWMQVSLCQFPSRWEHFHLCFWVVGGRKEVGHRCGLRFSSVHASPASSCGPAETWAGLARTKCFHLPQGHLRSSLAGGGRLTCQDTSLGLWASGRGHTLGS